MPPSRCVPPALFSACTTTGRECSRPGDARVRAASRGLGLIRREGNGRVATGLRARTQTHHRRGEDCTRYFFWFVWRIVHSAYPCALRYVAHSHEHARQSIHPSKHSSEGALVSTGPITALPAAGTRGG